MLEREDRAAGPRRLRDAVDLLQGLSRGRTASASSWAPTVDGLRGRGRPRHRRAPGRRPRRSPATPRWSASARIPNDELARDAGLELRQRRRRRPGGPHLRSRRSSPSATSPTGRCRSTTACSAWRACPTRWSRPSRPPAAITGRPPPAARGALVLVRPVRPEAADRRLRRSTSTRSLVRGDPAAGQVRRLPSEGRPGPGGRGDQRPAGVHDGQAAHRSAASRSTRRGLRTRPFP